MGEGVSIFNRVTFSKASVRRRLGGKARGKGKRDPLGVEEGTVSAQALSGRLVLKEHEKTIWGWSVVSREVSEEGNTSVRRTRT